MSVFRACIVVAMTVAITGTAHADRFSVHGLVSGDVALTDNEFSVPSDAEPEPDVYLQIRPGILLSSESARWINEVLAQAELLEYARHTDEPTYSAFGSWKSVVLPGPRSDMSLQVDGSTGKVNALSARTAADQTTVQVTPTGPTDVRAADASQNLGWQASKFTRTTETAFAQWSATDDNLAAPTTTDTLAAGLSLGFQRSFAHDTVAVNVGGEYLRLERLAPPGDIEGSHLENQLNPRADVTWLHDWSQKWSTSVQAGLIYVNPIGTDPYATTIVDVAQAYPVFTALVAYTDVWGHASISAGRSVAPNLFLAQNSVSDSILAQAAIPLTWLDANRAAHDPRLALVGTLGVARSELLDPDTNTNQGQFDIGRIDVGLLWTPQPGQTYGIRYELIVQHGDAEASTIEPSFFRDTLFFTFTLRYPDDILPKSPNTGPSMRSDRSDVAPAGGEPVVTGPVESAPGEAP